MSRDLDDLVGQAVRGIVAVEDYDQVVLDEFLVSIVNPAVLTFGNTVVTSDDEGWRESLGQLVGDTLVSLDVANGRAFEITFLSSRVLSISLASRDYLYGPEGVLIFTKDGHAIWIF